MYSLVFKFLLLLEFCGCIFIFNEEIAQLRLHSPYLNTTLNYINIFAIDQSIPLKILIHGYRQTTEIPIYAAVTRNYLLAGDVSVITVDYPQVSYRTYAECFFFTPTLEQYVAQFLKLLTLIGISPLQMHLIGQSLGGQIVGRVGNIFTGLSGGRQHLQRVTSLDPARIGYESVLVPAEAKITPASGRIVDVLHTDTQSVGVLLPAGSVDFYANRGLGPQPGCDASVIEPLIDNIPLTDGWIVPITEKGFCSHSRAIILYAQTILLRDSLIARRCLDWDGANRLCRELANETVVYGAHMPDNITGVFVFDTTSTPPFQNP